jgi:hypothetical protein
MCKIYLKIALVSGRENIKKNEVSKSQFEAYILKGDLGGKAPCGVQGAEPQGGGVGVGPHKWGSASFYYVLLIR